MPRTTDRKTVIRIAGLVLSFAGLAVSTAALLRFVRSVALNALDGSPRLAHNPEYYLQVGAYYSRGFTTGFFACYFLMMIAILVGSWVDESRKARRARQAVVSPEAAAPRAALAGGAALPD